MRFCAMTLAAVAAVTSGCATITNGGSQVIAVNTTPMGAACVGERDGVRVGVIASTPGTFALDKSRKTLLVTCERPGYGQVFAANPSHSSFATLGNIVFGGPVGALVDASTGADYEYASTMTLNFQPAPPYTSAGAALSGDAVPLRRAAYVPRRAHAAKARVERLCRVSS